MDSRRESILRSINHIKELVDDKLYIESIQPSNSNTQEQFLINKEGQIIQDTTDNSPTPDNSPKLDNPDNSPKLDNPDNSPKLDNTENSPKLDNTDNSPKLDNTENSPKLDNTENSPTPHEVTMIHGLIMNHGEMETHEIRASQCITTPLLQVFQLTQTEQLTVGGTTSISHVLDVSGDSTFSGSIHAKGIHDMGKTYLSDLIVDNSVDIQGKLYANSFQSSYFEIDEKGNMDISGDLWVGGHTSIYGGLGVSSGLIVNDDAVIMGSTKTPLLQVYELLTVGDMPPTPGHILNVAGDATFNGTIHTQGIMDTGTTKLTNVGVSDSIQVGKVWITQNGIMVLHSTTGYPAVWENSLTNMNEPIPTNVTHLYTVNSDSSAVFKINGSSLEYVSSKVMTNGSCTVYFVVNYISS